MQLAGKGKELVSDKLWQIIEPLLAPGPQKRVEDLVFTSKTGSPMSWNNWLGAISSPSCVRLTCLREHAPTTLGTPSVLMLEQGESPKVVQEILGHSRITHTMDTYSHVSPNAVLLLARSAGLGPATF